MSAKGLNAQAPNFTSIGYAAFTADQKSLVENETPEIATFQSPLVCNSQSPKRQSSFETTQVDTLPDNCDERDMETGDTPITAADGDCQSTYSEEEYDEWSGDSMDTEEQPQEQQLQIKSIELLHPSGFIPLIETDISLPYHRRKNQVQALQTLLLASNGYSSRNPQLNNCQLHDTDFINNRPSKLYTTWLSHHLEISDHLFRKICPSDLNNAPCEWDELPSGCPLLRLCSTRRVYPVPIPVPNSSSSTFSFLPPCHNADRQQCIYIHDVAPNCRSIDKYGRRDPRSRNIDVHVQPCPIVADQAATLKYEWNAEGMDMFCTWGHDFEGARLESLWRYWEHRAQARRRGSVALVKRDRFGRKVFVPKRPDVRSLVHVQECKAKSDFESQPRSGGMDVEMEDRESGMEGSTRIETSEGSLIDEEEEEYNDVVVEVEEEDEEGEEDVEEKLEEIDKTRFVGRTFHGHFVRLSFELGEKWTDGWYYTFRDLRAMAQGSLALRDWEEDGESVEALEDEDEDEDEDEEDEENDNANGYTTLERSGDMLTAAVVH